MRSRHYILVTLLVFVLWAKVSVAGRDVLVAFDAPGDTALFDAGGVEGNTAPFTPSTTYSFRRVDSAAFGNHAAELSATNLGGGGDDWAFALLNDPILTTEVPLRIDVDLHTTGLYADYGYWHVVFGSAVSTDFLDCYMVTIAAHPSSAGVDLVRWDAGIPTQLDHVSAPIAEGEIYHVAIDLAAGQVHVTGTSVDVTIGFDGSGVPAGTVGFAVNGPGSDPVTGQFDDLDVHFADPALLTVCLDGSGDFTVIQSAIDFVADGAVVELCPGTYDWGNQAPIRSNMVEIVGRTGLEIRGAGPGVVLDGRDGGTGSGLGRLIMISGGADIKVSDLELVHGTASSTSSPGQGGGGLNANDVSNVLLADCVVRYCEVFDDFDGGGLFFRNTGVTMTACVVDSNVSDTGDGGGFTVKYGSASMVDCQIRNNTSGNGGGFACRDFSGFSMMNCDILGNIASAGETGGGGLKGDNILLVDCLVVGNSAPTAAGLSLEATGQSVVLRGLTVADNFADPAGGAVRTSGAGTVTVERTIVADNVGTAFVIDTTCPSVACTILDGNTDGDWIGCLAGLPGTNGNLATPPLFCGTNDYTLRSDSPALPYSHPTDGCGVIGARGLGCYAPQPVISAITDVPDDQGRWVHVAFLRSAHDTDGLAYKSAETYSIQRDEDGRWVTVASGGAYAEGEYLFLAATAVDSTDVGTGLTTFRVIAHMDEGNWASQDAVGYSVDNIVPGTPGNFAVTNYDMASGNANLAWDPVADEDLAYYRVYRDDGMGWAEIGRTGATSYADPVSPPASVEYCVAAVDDAGNESALSSPAIGVSDVHDLSARRFNLSQNHPNPFNPSTLIAFTLDRSMEVTLVVYGLDGRRIRTLWNGPAIEGRNTVVWDGADDGGRRVSSGVYLYRLTTNEKILNRQMMLLK